jgi:hypothetical protein
VSLFCSSNAEMKKYQPPAVTIFPWLRANLGPRSLAPLTGTDTRALTAAVQIAELYSYHRVQSVADAFGAVVASMQPHTFHLAYHSIAHVMDWSDRADLWVKAKLPEFAPSTCSFEPGGSYVDRSKEK